MVLPSRIAYLMGRRAQADGNQCWGNPNRNCDFDIGQQLSPVVGMGKSVAIEGWTLTRILNAGCGMALCILLFTVTSCSTIESFLFEDLNRQERRISVDPAFFHGPAAEDNYLSQEEQESLLQVCLGKRRIGNLTGYRISEAALICAARGSLEQSDILFQQALQRSSGLDRRRIMLNRLIHWHRIGSDIRDQDLSPVLTELSHGTALQLVEELQNKRQDFLVDRIYSFMIPRSSGVALADVLLQKGLYEYSMGRPAVAAAALQETLKLRNNGKAHLALGRIYGEGKDYERAIKHLDQAFTAEPDSDTAFLLARFEFSRGNHAEALGWIKKANGRKADVVELHGLILLATDVGADPRPLLKSVDFEQSKACLRENRPFLENIRLCSFSNAYNVLRPIRGRGRIMRAWFGTAHPHNREGTLPYLKNHY